VFASTALCAAVGHLRAIDCTTDVMEKLGPAQRLHSKRLRQTARHGKSATCFTAPVAQLDRASGFEPDARCPSGTHTCG